MKLNSINCAYTCHIDAGITLSVSPTQLNTSGDWIVVSWSGVKDPDTHDWIGVYVLEKSGDVLDPKTKAPVKYQASTSSNALQLPLCTAL